ncbi:MAG: ABC transporter permease [Chloroflexota bacterium]|nr:ABC transporter permease [Chloroflexota bacterium]
MSFLSDTWYLLWRHIVTTIRIPIWLFVTIVQPIIWLTLYGQLFRRVVEIPGFDAGSYIQFLTPGVLIMSALFGAAWSGMGIISDLNDGIMDRFLATPIRPSAIVTAAVLHAVLTGLVQAVIILLMSLVLGARVPGGLGGVLAILLMASLLAGGLAFISNGIALVTRREETLISVANFFGTPLLFLSTAFMAADLMPGWIRAIARFNPVNWAIDASRAAMAGTGWTVIVQNGAYLIGFVLVAGVLAMMALRSYRQAI